MMARVLRPKLLFKTLALGLDKTSGQESGGHSDDEFKGVACPLRECGQRVDVPSVQWRSALRGCHVCVWGWSLQLLCLLSNHF